MCLGTQLSQNCDYWMRLPWLLCALAHEDESRARTAGAKALDAFLDDPRESAHHRLTWKLLHEGSAFRDGLELFIDGTDRWSCGNTFCEQVASFAFWPISETTIEAKHSRASMDAKKHHIGPVRVSLGNRLSMMEKLLVKSPDRLSCLLKHFSVARQMVKVSSCLNLGGHPLITNLDQGARKPWRLRVIFGCCDLHVRPGIAVHFPACPAERQPKQESKGTCTR